MTQSHEEMGTLKRKEEGRGEGQPERKIRMNEPGGEVHT